MVRGRRESASIRILRISVFTCRRADLATQRGKQVREYSRTGIGILQMQPSSRCMIVRSGFR